MNKILSKENKGITLIALVITIIVLLILAAVSIGMLLGENGILTQAEEAREEHRAGSVEEQRDLWLLEQNIKQQTNDDTMKIETVAEIANRLRDENKLLVSQAEVDSIITEGFVEIADRKIYFYMLTTGDTGTSDPGTGNPEDDTVLPDATDTIKVGDYVVNDTTSNSIQEVLCRVSSLDDMNYIDLLPVEGSNPYQTVETFRYEKEFYHPDHGYEYDGFFSRDKYENPPNWKNEIDSIREILYAPKVDFLGLTTYNPLSVMSVTVEDYLGYLKQDTSVEELSARNEYGSEDFKSVAIYEVLKESIGTKKVVLDKFEILENQGSNKEMIWNLYTLQNDGNGNIILHKEVIFNFNFEISIEGINDMDGSQYYYFNTIENEINEVEGMVLQHIDASRTMPTIEKGINYGTKENPWILEYMPMP